MTPTRRRPTPESPPWMVPAIALALAAFGIGVTVGITDPSSPDPEASTPSTSPATTNPQPTRPSLHPDPPRTSVTSSTTSPVQLARQVKPLADLITGDRVLYDGNLDPSNRPACHFLRWATSAVERGSNINAIIECPGEPFFETHTSLLTPVEPVPPMPPGD